MSLYNRRIRRVFRVSDIELAEGSSPRVGVPAQTTVTVDAHSRGLTNREYVKRSLEETLGCEIMSFTLVERRFDEAWPEQAAA